MDNNQIKAEINKICNDLFNIIKGKLKCISVLYENKKPSVYSINGEDRDLVSGKQKEARNLIKDILGAVDVATIDDSFSIFGVCGQTLSRVESNRDIKIIYKRRNEECDFVNTNEKFEYVRYPYIKKNIIGNENRFFTCAEKKILGKVFYLCDLFLLGMEENYELYSTKKPCVLCEPTLPVVYYLGDEKVTPKMYKQEIYYRPKRTMEYILKRTKI